MVISNESIRFLYGVWISKLGFGAIRYEGDLGEIKCDLVQVYSDYIVRKPRMEPRLYCPARTLI